MVIKRGVNGVGVVLRRQDAADVSVFGDAGESFEFAPILSGVFGNLDQAVVGADEKQIFLFGGFDEDGGVAIFSGGSVLGDGVGSPDFAHDREFVAIELAGDVAADGAPRIAAVVAAEDDVGGEIEARG